MTAIVPFPHRPVSVRPATIDDIPFMDALQSQYPKALGRFATSWFEGYINTGGAVIAEADPSTGSGEPGRRVGYCISRDRYQKRDELGIIYQLCVAPGEQRKLVGAELIKAVFERSAYGCKLYCCWCAQDLEANRFWESMGFVPIAFRAGSEKKGPKGSCRVHIFWQRRINDGDTGEKATPWWYPCQTSAGAMGAGRLVFPIPPGVHWKDVSAEAVPVAMDKPTLEQARPRVKKPRKKKIEKHKGPLNSITCTLRFGAVALPAPTGVEVAEKKPERVAKPKVKIDPKYAKAARQLRDVWSEHVNGGQFVLESSGKYDVARALTPPALASAPPLIPPIAPPKRLPHAA